MKYRQTTLTKIDPRGSEIETDDPGWREVLNVNLLLGESDVEYDRSCGE